MKVLSLNGLLVECVVFGGRLKALWLASVPAVLMGVCFIERLTGPYAFVVGRVGLTPLYTSFVLQRHGLHSMICSLIP